MPFQWRSSSFLLPVKKNNNNNRSLCNHSHSSRCWISACLFQSFIHCCKTCHSVHASCHRWLSTVVSPFSVATSLNASRDSSVSIGMNVSALKMPRSEFAHFQPLISRDCTMSIRMNGNDREENKRWKKEKCKILKMPWHTHLKLEWDSYHCATSPSAWW